ncbi:F-box domain - like 10 [Theobroma cacao]|uniref:SKP1/ASK-interacting protein 5 isoform 1 n=1 Tax=Theobroma cacao TaxID=3641 RepID=A0A061FS52_THECC|nr:SKP1/ASK-interacting protein 5 isoform 1 [Theobroma cacao]WRX11755.1 F-box domain - like 10 [Theobroma cacao]
MEVEEQEGRKSRKMKRSNKNERISSSSSSSFAPINSLDDGCLMHIFSFLSPIPDRYNTALVCHRWHYLACHPQLWLRVDRSLKDFSEPGVFPNIEEAVSAARPGDTILIAAGGSHLASNIQIRKPLCLIGGGELPDETTLLCLRGSDSALEFLSTCKLTNLTVKAELGCCLLHRSGRLIIDECILQCESNPLDYLSCPIVSTAGSEVFPSNLKSHRSDCVSVSHTRIEGGAKAVLTSGDLALQRVRVIYARTSLYFWFDVDCK